MPILDGMEVLRLFPLLMMFQIMSLIYPITILTLSMGPFTMGTIPPKCLLPMSKLPKCPLPMSKLPMSPLPKGTITMSAVLLEILGLRNQEAYKNLPAQVNRSAPTYADADTAAIGISGNKLKQSQR
ncbi:hypothetical protein NX722_06260 [Endozoicomonas gorgoniicola]|uniref:Uncharacterized protein n=1 Tax=Endozoicomonas gorgoniicola TaxID=1234144 RepID=A0ABT3MSB1_9GAMM|nr:hypothetical protein [Endozoicomonas gorgoniicola]MCW7552257.1 hypothetical protein [Endozoicomonas gorgoniicola]